MFGLIFQSNKMRAYRRGGAGCNGSRKGIYAFTLVELLVVVAIIALLVSILLPTLGKAKEQARIVMCASNIRGLGLSFPFYATENNGWYPAASPYGGSNEYMWDTILQPYYDVFGLLHCPSDRLDRNSDPYYDGIPDEDRHFRSYAINPNVTGMGPSPYGDENGYVSWYGEDRWPGLVRKLTDITDPSETIILAEMWEAMYWPSSGWHAGMYSVYHGNAINPWYSVGVRKATDDVHRNNDAANYLFCDGHARLIPANEPMLDWNNDYNYWWRVK